MTLRQDWARKKHVCPKCGKRLAFPGVGWERVWCSLCETTIGESYGGVLIAFDKPINDMKAAPTRKVNGGA